MEQTPTPIAVVDEGGELDDVREMLYELGLDFASWSKGTAPGIKHVPHQLLVATAGAAVSLGYNRERSASDRCTWIAVTCDDSRTQKKFLLRAGFNYLVRRPVHPTALRLLLQRALYQGEDMRCAARVVLGYTITYRKGIFSRQATLVDLSLGGCRILTKQPLELGAPVSVQFPRELSGGSSLSIAGHVLRTCKAELEGGDTDEVSVAVRFGRLGPQRHNRLCSILETLSVEAPSSGTASMSEPSNQADPGRPQRAKRGSYDGQEFVFGAGSASLVGRDLSRAGMRIEPQKGLEVGDAVRLALSAGTREEPIVVQGHVVRDDGVDGLAVKFAEVEEPPRLEALVRSLPEIESLADEDGSTVFLSRIVPTLYRIAKTDVSELLSPGESRYKG